MTSARWSRSLQFISKKSTQSLIKTHPFSFLGISASKSSYTIKLLAIQAIFVIIVGYFENLATASLLLGQVLLLLEDDVLKTLSACSTGDLSHES